MPVSSPSPPASLLAASRTLVDAARSCALVLLDRRGRVELWSPGAERLFGRAAGEMAGQTLTGLLPPGDEDPTWPAGALSAAASGLVEVVEEERWLSRADGTRLRVELAFTRAEAGTEIAFVARDVTRRARAEEERRQRLRAAEEARARAEQAGRARDELLGTLSHELRTPLTAIVGWAHLLRTGVLDAAGRARALEVIERNAQLQERLTADMLDISRIVSGRVVLEIRSLDPREAVQEAVGGVREEAQARGVEVECHLEPSRREVLADRDRLRQVVANLLLTVVRLVPPQGRVRLSVRPSGDTLEIAAVAAGCGASDDAVAHLFDRFGQGGRARGSAHALGLAVVRHLVELQGGSACARVEGEGDAVLAVRLPLEPPA